MAELTLPLRTEPRNTQHLAGRQRRADTHATVESRHLAGTRAGNRLRYGREGDMPASGAVQGHAVRFHPIRHLARPAEPYPAGLRYPGFTGFPAEPAHMLRLHSDNPESLVAPGLAPGRPAVRAREEVPHSLGEVSQRLLLSHLAARTQPLNLGPGLSELTRLLQVTGRAAAPGPPPGLLFDREVPHEPGIGAMVRRTASWTAVGTRR